jgi:hypothetical protein
MTGNVTSLGIGDGGRKIRGIKEPGDPNTVHLHANTVIVL